MEVKLTEIISEILRVKTANALGNEITKNEFNNITYQIRINKLKVDTNIEFNELCKDLISNNITNFRGKEIIFKDDKLIATYNCENRKIVNCFSDPKIQNFVYFYVQKLKNSSNIKKNSYDLTTLSEEKLDNIKNVCKKIIETSIHNYELAKVLNETYDFNAMYENALMVIANLISKEQGIYLSNNPYNALAFANYLRIISPFNFNHIYNRIDKDSLEFYIITTHNDYVFKNINYEVTNIYKKQRKIKYD